MSEAERLLRDLVDQWERLLDKTTLGFKDAMARAQAWVAEHPTSGQSGDSR